MDVPRGMLQTLQWNDSSVMYRPGLIWAAHYKCDVNHMSSTERRKIPVNDDCFVCNFKHMSNHLVVCLTTDSKPLPKRALHIERTTASSFKWEYPLLSLTLWRRNFFFNFSTLCIQNVNNTETKQASIMKQTAFWKEKNGEYRACLKYSVPIFVE